MNQRADRRRELFAAAAELPTAVRPDYLARACDDPELRAEVLNLLDVSLPSDFLEPPDLGTALLPVTHFGHYRVVRELADDLPDTYLGQHDGTGRFALIRTARPTSGLPEDAVTQCVRAAHRMNVLRHPHCIQAREHGYRSGTFWMAFDHAGDHHLGTELARQRLAATLGQATGTALLRPDQAPWPATVLRLALILVEIVQTAHRAGIPHGSLGVTSVRLTPAGRPMLGGFGWSSLLTTHPTEPAADIRAFGQMLYETLDIDPTAARDRLGSGLLRIAQKAELGRHVAVDQVAAELRQLATETPPRSEPNASGGWFARLRRTRG